MQQNWPCANTVHSRFSPEAGLPVGRVFAHFSKCCYCIAFWTPKSVAAKWELLDAVRSVQTKNELSYIPVSPWPRTRNSRITRLHVREVWDMIFSLPCFLKKIQIGFSYHHVAACFLSLFLSVSLTHFSASTSRSIFTKFGMNIMTYEATLMPCFVTTLRIHWHMWQEGQ